MHLHHNTTRLPRSGGTRRGRPEVHAPARLAFTSATIRLRSTHPAPRPPARNEGVAQRQYSKLEDAHQTTPDRAGARCGKRNDSRLPLGRRDIGLLQTSATDEHLHTAAHIAGRMDRRGVLRCLRRLRTLQGCNR